MIIESKYSLPVSNGKSPAKYPLLALRTGVLFPGAAITIHVGRPENLMLIKDCYADGIRFVASYAPSPAATSPTPAVHEVGVIAQIESCHEGVGNSLVVTIKGEDRVRVSRIVESGKPYRMATAVLISSPESSTDNVVPLQNEVISIVKQITALDQTYSAELLNVLEMSLGEPSRMADLTAASFHFALPSKQDILESLLIEGRFERLVYFLGEELNRVATVHSIDENARRTLRQDQRDAFLRQKLHEIKKQLGDDFAEEQEAAKIKSSIKSLPGLPPEVIARATIEADRLSQISSASAEYGVTKNYLDWILSLPWSSCKKENYDIKEAEKILATDYFGPSHIKEQILQRLAVRKLLGGESEGPTLCLVGAPGTGKASLAKAIARALGKEFIRISVGGISDAADIKGTPRTFLGAMPGRMIRTLREAGSCDPVILIEDIDFFNMDNDSSVNMALLDAIDNRRNAQFLDNYLGVPFDLSKVFFICSVRAFEEIPEQFVPRLEVVELPGFIEKEKITISKKYILPGLLKKHGIKKTEITLGDKMLAKIISDYTQEAGLLGFHQQMEKICRRIALEKQSKKKRVWRFSPKELENYLGPPIYIPEKAEKQPEIGTATGLAWTGAGGDLMFIEGLKMKGEGQIITTGSLGEIMRESIQAAHSYVRSKADMLAIDSDDFNQFDVHIHFPSGAIPKDGPSAGVTVSLVIASVMSERPIRNDIAMTGEVTLRGRVLPVGGIKEKISAAFRAGIFRVVMPIENRKDLKELPREILRKVKFTFIERVDELFEVCLLDFTPSSFSLEKIFAEEIAKARGQKKRTPRKKSAKSKVSKATPKKKK